MDCDPSNISLESKPYLISISITIGVARPTSWTQNYRNTLGGSSNGNQDHVLVFILDTLLFTPGPLRFSSTPRRGRCPPSFFLNKYFTTISYMRAGSILPNLSYLFKCISELSSLEHFDTVKTWFEQYLEGEPEQDEDNHADAETLKRPK